MNRLLHRSLGSGLAGGCASATTILCALALCGCGGAARLAPTQAASNPVGGTAISGKVHGGQNPISGASVYLYASNTTGYGGPGETASSSNESISLLTSGTKDGNGNYYVSTGSDGSFSVTGDYVCPGANSQLYLYAAGGNNGSGINSAASLLAGLGTCSTVVASPPYVVINEVSTIATAYAIAGFASNTTHISSSSSTLAATGVANAFSTITNLETLGTGAALATTLAGNGTAPQSEINTLANILAACINSSGEVTGPTDPTPCYTLFTNALSGGTPGTQPTDTAAAALNIAHNPGANVDNLFALQTASSPFQPGLSKAPNDFTIAVSYTGGGQGYPWGIAIDASDNVWVANNGTTGPVSKFNPLGGVLSGSNGFTDGGLFVPISIAIDGSGNVWVPDAGNSKLTELNPSGTAHGSSPFTGGGLDSPNFIAIDGSNNIWMTNGVAAEISEFSSTGTPITGSTGYPASNLSGNYIAADTSGNIWVTSSDPDNGGLFEFNSSGQVSGNSPITGSGLGDPQGVAIDASGNVWVANGYGDLSEFNSSGSPISGSGGFSGGGLDGPVGLAIDGSGDVWAVSSIDALSEFNSSGAAISDSGGYQAGSLDSPVALAIDGSGNIWVTSFSGNANAITEFVGAAAPVVTPLAANLMSPYGEHAVNRP
jgi:hypothetical protein